MGASGKLAEKLQPIAEARLHRGEELRGVLATTAMKLYGGKTYVLIVTDKRLVIQPTTRTWEVLGTAIPIHPDEIASYELRGMAERTLRGPLARFSRVGFVLKIMTTDQRPYDLMGWNGGKLGGGELQSAGVAALDAWLDALDFGE